MAAATPTHLRADPSAAPDAVADRVRKVLTDILGAEPARLTDDARLTSDLGADSLDAVELAIALDDEFGIDLPDEAVESCRTVGDVVAAVRPLVDAAAALLSGGRA